MLGGSQLKDAAELFTTHQINLLMVILRQVLSTRCARHSFALVIVMLEVK